MPSQRKKGKKLVGFFATEDEAAAIIAAAKSQGMTVADWLRSLIPQKDEGRSPTSKKRGAKGKE
jgi:hypothetical protein